MADHNIQSKPLRVLFITQSRIYSGAEVNLVSLLNTIDIHKIKPYLCFHPQSRMDKYITGQDVTVLPWSLPVYKKENIFLIVAAMLRLLRLLIKSRIKLVYANGGSGAEFKYSISVCRLLRLPVILHLHIHEDDNSLRYVKADLADRLLFPSKATMEAVLTTSPWLNRKKCFYVHNGVDLKEYYPRQTEALRQELAITSGLPVVGIAGQLKEIKGQHLFVEMAKNLTSQGINAHYLIVGKDATGEYENRLKNMVIDFGIENIVYFLGFRKDIPEFMSLCDLLVVPSLREQFGRVVIEAMACGTPVVASAVGGMVEIFEDGDGGLFCKPNDVNDLTEKVKFFFENPDWWKEQKLKALNNARENFSQANHTAAIERHIHQVAYGNNETSLDS